MKKLILFTALLAALPMCAQGTRYDSIALRDTGSPAGGATIRVCTKAATGGPGCSPLAPIYNNQALSSSKSNPFTGDSLGNFGFYAAPGEYIIEISGAGISTHQLINVLIPPVWSGPFTAGRCVRTKTDGTGLEIASLDCGVGGGGGGGTNRATLYFIAAGANGATAASAWDLPASAAATPNVDAGSNVIKGTLDFLDTSGGFSAQNLTRLPANFDAAAAVEARIVWYTSVTNTSLNAKWYLYTVCTAQNNAELDNPTFSNLTTVTSAASATGLSQLMAYMSSVTVTGCTAGEMLHIKLFRDGGDAADTLGGTARFVGLELTYGTT